MITTTKTALLILLAAGIPLGAMETYEEMNSLLGIPLWQDDNLWDDSADEVAERLEWPGEGKTKRLASYRYYPEQPYAVMGQSVNTAVLYARNGAPHRLSLMFTNKGDFAPFLNNPHPSKEQIDAFHDALEEEADLLEAKLTQALGPPVRDKTGRGRKLRERMDRWDWKAHSIVLSHQDEEFVALRVFQPDFLESGGQGREIEEERLKKELHASIEKRPNGDVVIREIPMVDQGPKGYCVPATWERYLRFLGIPADMYTLARAGSSGYGGGTYLGLVTEVVEDIARRHGRKLDSIDDSLDPDDLADFIDEGLPVMWAVFAQSTLYQIELTKRSLERENVSDWEQWENSLEPHRERVNDLSGLRLGGHVCMIIGYNKETREIATSDSWGPMFEERWMTVEEAEALSQGQMQIIKW